MTVHSTSARSHGHAGADVDRVGGDPVREGRAERGGRPAHRHGRFGAAEGSHATPSEVSLSYYAYPEAVKNAALMAYLAVVGPKLQNGTRNETAVLADLQRKAHASKGVNPGQASSASPKTVGSFYDPSLQW